MISLLDHIKQRYTAKPYWFGTDKFGVKNAVYMDATLCLRPFNKWQRWWPGKNNSIHLRELLSDFDSIRIDSDIRGIMPSYILESNMGDSVFYHQYLDVWLKIVDISLWGPEDISPCQYIGVTVEKDVGDRIRIDATFFTYVDYIYVK